MWIGMMFLAAVVLIVYVVQGRKGGTMVAREKIKQGAMVIDVRTPAEYEEGHFKDARNIPLQELNRRLAQLGDKHQAIVVYCASGARSAQAAGILTAAGFKDVTNAGGLSDLTAYGS